jgi:hypothetical protein
MSRWWSVVVPAAGLGSAAIVFTGCTGSLDPLAPMTRDAISVGSPARGAAEPSSAGLFYPLDVGNHWAFDRIITTRTIPNQGEPGAPYVGESTMDVDLVGPATQLGREYVVQRETHHVNGFDFSIDFLYRQDRGGLYNADPAPASAALALGDPGANALVDRLIPANARSDAERLAYRQALRQALETRDRVARIARSGFRASANGRPGPLTGEVALLRYPLHPNATWNVREDPLVVYLVEGSESLALPAGTFKAFRIKIDWPGTFGPNDRAHVWYGGDGLVRLQVHVEANATDAEGNVVGRVVTDETQELTALSLVGSSTPSP